MSEEKYKLMGNLTHRKIYEKRKLALLERAMDNTKYETEKVIAAHKLDIAEKEKTYVQEHKDQQRIREMNLNLLIDDYRTRKGGHKTAIEEAEKNYVGNFNKWKEGREIIIMNAEEDLARYLQIQKSKILAKERIISELDSTLMALKEENKGE